MGISVLILANWVHCSWCNIKLAGSCINKKNKYENIPLMIFALPINLAIHLYMRIKLLSCVFYLFYVYYVCTIDTGIATHTVSHTRNVTLATVHAQLTHLGSL